MKPVILSSYELGQLYVLIPYSSLSKLSPDLKRKLKEAFEQAERPDEPVPLATEED